MTGSTLAGRASDGSLLRRLRVRLTNRSIGFAVFVALLLVPIVGHGCHGDDVDHEPATVPQTKPQENRP